LTQANNNIKEQKLITFNRDNIIKEAIMINNINKTKLDSVIGLYNTSKPVNTKSNIKTGASDSLTISNTAHEFRFVYETVSKIPDIREEKVNDIASRMKNGNYNISSSDIASKILSSL